MKYIRLKSNDPYYNLAVEEYLLNNSTEDIFMIWQNDPVVVIGKNQNAYAEVNLAYAKENDIRVCRRITGGGAVYHDLGNVNYTFITSTEKAQALNYEYFTRPIIDALSFFGLDCKLSGRNDLECQGKKFSGNAQYSSKGRILHHGTLLFNADLSVMSSVLKVDKEKLEYKAVKSHKGRVINLYGLLGNKLSVDGFIEHIEKYVIEYMSAEKCEIADNEKIEELRKRNSSDEWIYSDKRYLTDYTLHKRKKYPFGIVNVEMKLAKGIIDNIVISGDFFGLGDIKELESKLLGKNPNKLDYIDISSYIDKMTFDEFVALLKE